MASLQGLKGLIPDPQDTTSYMDEGVLEARATPGTPDSDHGSYGSQYNGYSGTVPTQSPFSGFAVYDGFNTADNEGYSPRSYDMAGRKIDDTPTSHQSPYPRGIVQQSWSNPDALALAGSQLQELHGPDLGGVEFNVQNAIPGREEITHYTTDNYIAPNSNYLSPDVPGQLRGAGGNNGVGASGHGNADTTQGYGVLNSMEEFNAGHSIRRVQHDSVHFDYTNTHGEQGVPFYGRHPVEQMPLDGPDSPYFEQGSIDGANVPWEGRITDPSPYTQAPEPAIGNAPAQSDFYPSLSF
jgi:hypothetical protein